MKPANRMPEQLPRDALHFAAPFEFAPAEGEGAKRQVRGVAYSGAVVTQHHYWPAVIFDLATMAALPKIPVLIDHDTARRAGFGTVSITDKVTLSAELLDNEHGKSAAADGDAGYPWQLSLTIIPAKVEFFDAGQKVKVNGSEIEGPCHVFRNALIRECSLVSVAADHRTAAQVFARDPGEGAPVPIEDPEMPDNTDTTAAALAAEKTKNAELEQRFAALEAERNALKTANETAAAAAEEARKTSRFAAVVGLFKEIGKAEPKDQAAVAQYIAMDDATFSAVAADLRAAKPAALPAQLFSHVATGTAPGAHETGNGAGTGAELSPFQYAAAIREEKRKAKTEGRTISEVEAAAIVRARASA